MNFKRLLNTETGRICISIILGLGLAALFRKVCNDKNCIVFNGPIISEFEDKTFKYDEKCYKYSLKMEKCNTNKNIVDISSPSEEFVNKNTFI